MVARRDNLMLAYAGHVSKTFDAPTAMRRAHDASANSKLRFAFGSVGPTAIKSPCGSLMARTTKDL